MQHAAVLTPISAIILHRRLAGTYLPTLVLRIVHPQLRLRSTSDHTAVSGCELRRRCLAGKSVLAAMSRHAGIQAHRCRPAIIYGPLTASLRWRALIGGVDSSAQRRQPSQRCLTLDRLRSTILTCHNAVCGERKSRPHGRRSQHHRAKISRSSAQP